MHSWSEELGASSALCIYIYLFMPTSKLKGKSRTAPGASWISKPIIWERKVGHYRRIRPKQPGGRQRRPQPRPRHRRSSSLLYIQSVSESRFETDSHTHARTCVLHTLHALSSPYVARLSENSRGMRGEEEGESETDLDVSSSR